MSSPTIFGRTRSGRSPWPQALAAGLAVSLLAGVGAALLRPDGWVSALLIVLFTLPVATAGGWVLVVDRETVRGATPRPEHSVESAWLERAGFGSFFDMIAVAGLATGVFSLVPALSAFPAWAALGGLTLFGMADLWVRYLVLSRRTA